MSKEKGWIWLFSNMVGIALLMIFPIMVFWALWWFIKALPW